MAHESERSQRKAAKARKNSALGVLTPFLVVGGFLLLAGEAANRLTERKLRET